VGNPPYVPITELEEEEKRRYRSLYATASGRFDLYLLFFEQSLRSLNPGGRLVLITPEKFLYVETAAPLRRLLTTRHLEEIHMLQEDIFGDLVTYPTVTVLTNEIASTKTAVILRDGRTIHVSVSDKGSSWLPEVNGKTPVDDGHTLIEICRRISCGVATGADSIFVRPFVELETALSHFAYPTLAGRELTSDNRQIQPRSCLLVPYALNGSLIGPGDLGALGVYLSRPQVRRRLEERTCVSRKPWYAFHETPVLHEILRPKILCKDIASEPHFWIDRKGAIVPRHTVYYIVPRDPSRIDELADYLNSPFAREWLHGYCQRASKGYLRIQSRILKKLPIPLSLTKGTERNTTMKKVVARGESAVLEIAK